MDETNYDVLKLENQLCFPLYAASREVIKAYRPLLDSIGLTYTQYIAMMILWEHGAVSCKQLGEMLFLDSGTLTPVLKSLEKKGLIKRGRAEKDERLLMAEITEDGLRLRESALNIPSQMAGCVRLDSSEAAELYRLLYKLLGKNN